jgi:hypothetical protein
VSLRIVDFFEVERNSLGEVAQGLIGGAALAGYVDLKTLRHLPVLFLMYCGGQVPRGAHGSSVAPSTPFRLLPRPG